MSCIDVREATHLVDMVEPEGWTLAPKAAAGAMGAGVDCAGPDAGSMMHTMALGAVSLAVQPPPPRHRGVTREIDIPADESAGVPETVKFSFHGATHTLACVVEAGLARVYDRIDFSGVLAERLPNGRVVVVLLRAKSTEPRAADQIIVDALRIEQVRYRTLRARVLHMRGLEPEDV